MDDVVLTQTAECAPVQYPTVASIVGTSATVSWQPNMVGGTSTYNVSLINLDNNSIVSVGMANDTFYTFTGLNYSTHYRALISVNCTNGLVSQNDSVEFRTLTPPVQIPYSENFEGATSTYEPYFDLHGTGANQWYFGPATGATTGGDTTMHALYVSGDSGLTNTYIETEESYSYASFNVIFPSTPLEYHLSFDYKVKGLTLGTWGFDFLSVYMMDATQTIPAVGPPSGTPLIFEVTNVNDWQHFDVLLENVPGTSKQIVFYWEDFGWNNSGESLNPPAAIDNIEIYGFACAQPNTLAATNITTDSATLSWHEAGSATAWTVYYKAVNNTGTYTAIEVSDTTSITLSGLVANTQYNFYVRSHCDSNELSSPSVTASFRTDCGPIDVLPFYEGFENGLYNSPQYTYVACWDRLTTGTNTFAYVNEALYGQHTSPHYLDFNYTPSCANYAIMPELGQAYNASDMLLSFYVCHTFNGVYGSIGTLEVGVMTDKTNDTTFMPLDTIDLSLYDSYVYVGQLISLANYNGTGKYIAFRVSNCDNTSYYIDDVLLELRPACMYPLDFHKVTVSNHSVTLGWDDIGNVSAWNILYDTTGFTPGNGGQLVTSTNTTFTVNGLTNLTSYDFYVQANCGNNQSEWIGPVTAITGIIAMNCGTFDTLTTCNAIICDDGGDNGDYSSDCISTLVIYPSSPDDGLQITGTASLHPGYSDWGSSYLTFYDGVGISHPILGNYTGDSLNIAVATSGPITIQFSSGYFTAPGFLLNVFCSSCTPPSNISVNNVEPTSATVSWAGGSGQYHIYLTGDTTATLTASGNSIQISGLSTDGNYYVQVQSICGSDTSLRSNPISFHTPCEAITITEQTPWVEDFESYAGEGIQPLQCWTRTVVDANTGAPYVQCGHAPACHSGVNTAEFKGNGIIAALPIFTNDVHELRLTFWLTSTNPAFGTMEVGVLSNASNPNTFELVGITGLPGPCGFDSTGNGIFMGPYDFSGVQATNGRIAFRYTNGLSSASWYIDDITVSIAPTCFAPASLTVNNITTTGATVQWTSDSNQVAWALQHKAAADSVWSAEIACTTPIYTFTNLTPSTTYQVRVKSVCDSIHESEWSSVVAFTTEEEVVIVEPTVVTYPASDIEDHTAILHGAINPGTLPITARGFEWRLTSESSYSILPTGTSNILMFGLSDLEDNTSYTYRAFATTDDGTTYGEEVTFLTLVDTTHPCTPPTSINLVSATDSSITISWPHQGNVTLWNVQYRAVGGIMTSATTPTNQYMANGLMPNTTYEFQVQAECGGDFFLSEWSDLFMFATTGIAGHLQGSIILYPNPTKEYLEIRVDGDVNVTGIEVYDVYGKLVNIVETFQETPIQMTRINVSDLANGMYFVRFMTGEGTVTKTFVKK